MGNQFSSFVGAVYQLYSEEADTHSHNRGVDQKASYTFPTDDTSLKKVRQITSRVTWDSEGYLYYITFNRKCGSDTSPSSDEADLIEITIDELERNPHSYIVDGRDLCYATAKAYTEAIKKHGFYGYYTTTGGNCNGWGDAIDIHMILFIKAYALDAMEVRERKTLWKDEDGWMKAEATQFDKEIELLLFDM